MDDKTYNRITRESKREQFNRHNGILPGGNCLGCDAGFTSFRNADSHSCPTMPNWRVCWTRTWKVGKAGVQEKPGYYECHAPNQASAARKFRKRSYNKNVTYTVTGIFRL